MNSLGRRKVYALALVAALVAGITPGIAAEGAETVQEVVANFTGTPIIKTDSDFGKGTAYPAIVNVKDNLEIQISNLQKYDVVRVKGENHSVMARIYLGNSGEKTLNWIPQAKDEGIYQIQVLRFVGRSATPTSLEEAEAFKLGDGWIDLDKVEKLSGFGFLENLANHAVRSERKVYVNPENSEGFLQMTGLEVSNSKASDSYRMLNGDELMEMDITTPASYQLEPETTTPSAYKLVSDYWNWSGIEVKANIKNPTGVSAFTRFTISEPGMWSYRIRNWWDNDNTIKEYENFIARSGQYSVLAELKGWNSIEAQDYKTTSFNKDYVKVAIDSANPSKWVKVHKIEITNATKTGNTWTIEAKCNQKGCDASNLEYAFLKEDDLGLTQVSDGYTSSNTVEIPALNWGYKLIARVKHKDECDVNTNAVKHSSAFFLPASYEDQVDTYIGEPGGTSLLSGVKVTRTINQEKHTTTGAIKDTASIGIGGTAPANGGELNYITVVPTTEDANLQYKAWAIDDGVIVPLGEYSNKKEFVYYPKSGMDVKGETHKLVVSVRRLDGNGKPIAKQTGEFTLNIE